jgi:hypothetical protein
MQMQANMTLSMGFNTSSGMFGSLEARARSGCIPADFTRQSMLFIPSAACGTRP